MNKKKTIKSLPERPAVCIHVGARIRLRRTELGISLTDLGKKCKFTAQQMHKYERGMNTLRIDRLQVLANALDVPSSFFLEGMQRVVAGEADYQPPEFGVKDLTRQTLAVMRAYNALPTRAKKHLRYFLEEMVAVSPVHSDSDTDDEPPEDDDETGPTDEDDAS